MNSVLETKPNIVNPEKPLVDRPLNQLPSNYVSFIEENKALLEKYSPSQNYKLNSFVDRFDQKSSCWRVAIVNQRSEKTVDITYEGWSSKYDEKKINLNDVSIAAFRKYTVGYTGQPKQAYRHFFIKEEELKEMIELMKDQISCNFSYEVNTKKYTPWQWTQEYRGKLYVFLDSVIALMHYYELGEGQKVQINLVLNIFAEFASIFLSCCKDWKMYFLANQFKHDLFLVNLNCAIAATFSEIHEILKLLFGSNSLRTDRSFQAFICKFYGDPGISESKARQIFVSSFRDNLKSKKFFEIALAIARSNDYTFNLAFRMLDLLDHLGKNSIKDEYLGSQFFPQFSTAFNTRIIKPSEEDKIEISNIEINKLFEKLSALISHCRDGNYVIKMRMNIENEEFAASLQSDLLKAKLEGIEKIKNMFGITQLIMDNFFEVKTKEKLDAVCKRLVEMNIVSAMLSKHSHSMLVKYSKEIIHLLVVHGDFAEKEVQLFWNQAMTSPEDMKRALLDVLSDIAQHASLDLCQIIFRLIKTLPLEKYDLSLLMFFTNYTIKALDNESRKKAEYEKYIIELDKRNERKRGQGLMIEEADQTKNTEKFELYDIEILWKLVQITSFKTGLKEIAKKNLIDILGSRKELIPHFYKLALNKVTIDPTVSAAYMWLVRAIYLNYKQYLREEVELGFFIKETKMIVALVKRNIKYLKFVDEKLSAKYPEGKVDEKNIQLPIAETEFVAGAKHIEQVEENLNFIEFAITVSNSSDAISTDVFDNFWEAYIGMPNHTLRSKLCTWERSLFLKALNKNFEAKNKKECTLVSDQICSHLFLKSILNPERFNLLNMDIEGYSCFYSFFIRHNIIKGGIKLDSKKNLYINLPNLIDGIKELFIIAFNTQNQYVEEQSILLLISLYQGFIIKIKEKDAIIELYNGFCSCCLEQIKREQDLKTSEHKIIKFIGLLNQLIKIIEGDRPEKCDKFKTYADPKQITSFIYIQGSSKIKKSIYFYDYQTLADLKKTISHELSIPVARLKISVASLNNLILTSSYDGTLMKTLKQHFRENFLVEALDYTFPLEKHPSYAIGNKAELIVRLLYFMSLSEEITVSIWNILKYCYIADNIKLQFYHFCNSSETCTPKIFEFASHPSTLNQYLYSLHIFQKLIAKKEKVHNLNEQYIINFVAKGGFEFIFTNLLSEHIIKPSFTSYIYLKIIKYGYCALNNLLSLPNNATTIITLKYLPDKLKETCIDYSLLCFDIALREMSKNGDQILSYDSKGRPTSKSILFSKAMRELLKFINICGAQFGEKIAISSFEKSQILSQCLNKLFRINFKGGYNDIVYNTILSQIVVTPVCEGETWYRKYLLKLILYEGLLGNSNICELKAIYYDILSNLIENSTEATLDLSMAVERQAITKLAQIAIEFYNYPEGLQLKGVLKIIEILYRKYTQKLAPGFANLSNLVDMLIAIVSPQHSLEIESNENRSAIKIDEAKLMANGAIKEPGVKSAALSLLKKFCIDNIKYLHKLAKVFAPLVNQNINWRANTLKSWKLIL